MLRPSRFRTKLFLLTITPLLVVQLVTFLAILRTVQQDVTETARNSLQIGVGVAADYLSARSEQLRSSVAVLAGDFGLKEATATRDAPTVRSVLTNHSRRIGAELAAIVSLDAELLGSTTDLDGVELDVFVDALDAGRRDFTLEINGSPYQLVVVPLRAPAAIAWVALGFRIDRQLENRLAGLTGLDVSIAGRGDFGGTFGNRPGVDIAAEPYTVYTTAVDGDELLSINKAFNAHSEDVVVVLQRSMQAVLAPYVEARRNLIIFGVVLSLLAASACAWFSTTVSEPLKVLGTAARRMTSGDYRTGVTLRSTDEFGQLADSFNAMRTAIADRERHISHYATHDALTDLPNRSRTLKDLDRLIASTAASSSCVSVLSVHLSRMAEITSTLGHDAHDELIKLAAKSLASAASNAGVVYHIGTNEFAVVLSDTSADKAAECAAHLQQLLDGGTRLGSSSVILHSVVGIAEYPRHATTAEDLLRFASIARVQADSKGARCGRYHLNFEAEFQRRLKIVNDIPSAIRHREFQVWFQPKAQLPSGEVKSVECLVRWIHSDMGFLSPDDFIPAAEKSGLIVELSRFVIEEACRACRSWENDGRRLNIAVNLSTRDLMDPDLGSFVAETLARYELDPGRLTLEVTESSVMEDVPAAVAVLENLRHQGVKVSMDDFGTGHSSLAQLRLIPLDELKIDKAFVSNLASDEHDAEIVRTVIGIAHGMNLEVVAEGVEDEETVRRLSAMGCERVQGYFLSKPLPSQDFLDWLCDYQPTSFEERRSDERPFSSIA